MSRMNKFGYRVGRALGYIFIYGMYLIGFVGMAIEIKDMKVPLVPLAFLFVLSSWRRIVQIQALIGADVQIGEIRNFLLAEISSNRDADKIMSQINPKKFGGMN